MRAVRLRSPIVTPATESRAAAPPIAQTKSFIGHPHSAAMCRLLSHMRMVSPLDAPVDRILGG